MKEEPNEAVESTKPVPDTFDRWIIDCQEKVERIRSWNHNQGRFPYFTEAEEQILIENSVTPYYYFVKGEDEPLTVKQYRIITSPEHILQFEGWAKRHLPDAKKPAADIAAELTKKQAAEFLDLLFKR